jgi:hypothetical protein
MVIPRRVWKMAMSAVCSVLQWNAYGVAYGNTIHQGAAMWRISLTIKERLPRKPTATRHARETPHIFVEVPGGYNFIFGTAR